MAEWGLPPPPAFGLPAAFPSWRPDQPAALQRILDRPERFVGLTIPTGGGKSLIYMAAATLTAGRTVILTSTKGLQSQLLEDFTPLGLVDMRGQGAYPCRALQQDGEWATLRAPLGADEAEGCDRGPCRVQLPCTLKTAGCAYYDQRRRAEHASLVVTNYAYWLAQRRYSGGLGPVDLLVLDEAHAAVEELAGVLTIHLDRWLCSAVGVPVPKEPFSVPQWRAWATHHAGRLRHLLDTKPPSQSAGDLKYRRRLRAAEGLLQAMAAMTPGNWVEDSTPEALVFEILRPAPFAESLLFQGAKKVVLTSATLNTKTLQLLGVPWGAWDLWECPSRFPVARRPVYYIPTCRVDTRMTPGHQTAWLTRIDQILAARPAQKGIIHTVSYKRAAQIVAHRGHDPRLLIPKAGAVAETVGAFKLDPRPTVLVSPSLGTGWDFPDDTCRFQIVAKLPFPDTRSRILQARSATDPDYLPYLMVQALVQSVGRGMRSASDWCDSFVIDNHWEWVRGKYRSLMPGWFLQAVQERLTIPAPPVGDP